jgi:hypothetical protein
MSAIIKNGRWVNIDGSELNPIELMRLPKHIKKIHEVVKESHITHSRINVVSNVINASEIQCEVMYSIMSMPSKELERVKSVIKYG